MQRTEGIVELSLYEDNLTKKCIVEQITYLKKVFPKLDAQFFDILKDRFADNNFTDKRIVDSVKHVVDHYKGWERMPNIADFIQYDKKIRLFSWKEISEEQKSFGSSIWTYYFKADIDGKLYYVLKTDIEKHNLKLKEWSSEEHKRKTESVKITGEYKDGNPVEKTINLVDEFNKIVDETGKGTKIEGKDE